MKRWTKAKWLRVMGSVFDDAIETTEGINAMNGTREEYQHAHAVFRALVDIPALEGAMGWVSYALKHAHEAKREAVRGNLQRTKPQTKEKR